MKRRSKSFALPVMWKDFGTWNTLTEAMDEIYRGPKE